MKKGLVILLLIVSCYAYGQNTDPVLQYLVKNQLLTKQQVQHYSDFYRELDDMMLQQVNSAKTKEEKESIEQYRQSIRKNGFFHINDNRDTFSLLQKYLVPSIRGSIYTSGLLENIRYRDSDKLYYASAIDSLKSYARVFLTAGMTHRKEMERVIDQIQEGEILDSFSVAAGLGEAARLYEQYSSEEVFPLLEKLGRLRLLSDADRLTLMQNIKDSLITNPYVILSRMNRTAVFNSDVPVNDSEYLFSLHQKVSGLMPFVRFSSFKQKVVLDEKISDTAFRSYEILVSFSANGKNYSMKSFFLPNSERKERLAGFPRIDGEFFQVYNKVLRDIQSPYRLHSVGVSYPTMDASGKMAILLLTKTEEDSLMHNSLIMFRPGNYKGGITSSQIHEAIEQYKTIGLFSHLTIRQIDSSIAKVAQENIEHYSDILNEFKNLVFEIDLEYGVDDKQYKKLTQQIAAISRGHFKPANIIDTYSWETGKKFDYGFTLKGKVYRQRLEQDDDWLDPRFWELIEKAMSEQDKQGKFYSIYPNDGMRYIYLTHEQYRILNEKKILELEPLENGD